jgi:GMP synthase (glutamine-hydrolysing)
MGFCALGLSFFVTALAKALWVLIVVRLFAGAMQANLAIANAYVADITPPEDRARRFGLLGAMFGLGFILGPVMGGLLGGIDVHYPFYAAGALALVNLAYGVVVLPESLPPSRRKAIDWTTALNPFAAFAGLARLAGVGLLVAVIALSALAQFVLYTTWVLYTTFKFGWGPTENGWSLFAVGVVSALVQGLLLGKLLKRFSPQRLAVAGLVSSTLAYVGYGLAPNGWVMVGVVAANLLGFTVTAAIQSIVSGAADGRAQGRTLGAVSGLQSLMAVVAPLVGAPLLGAVSHLPRGDWRIGAPFFFCALLQGAALLLAVLHFRRMAGRPRPTSPRVLPAMHDKVLILDFGSQVTQLIARRVREAHVFCEIHPNDVTDDFVRAFAPKAVILSGSHASTYEAHDLRAPAAVFGLGVPVLGICYGMFAMAVQLGGDVEASPHREFGYAEVRAHGHTRLLDGIEDFSTTEGHGMLRVWMSHGDKVTALPSGFSLMASTPSCPIAAMADESRGFYGVQFHPEVTHTHKGREILERFVLQIAGCRGDWVMGDYIEEAVAKIRSTVGTDEVILGLSGGVDSSVAAALVHRAIGDQLTCVFVDHGLLRLDEARLVMGMFAGRLHAKVIHVDAGEQFLGALAGVADPEAKRKIIGREFVEVFTREAGRLTQARWLAQGTIYPDVIESGSAGKKAAVIKSHHNVGGLPETLGLKLLEPLRELFKDEVRELGVALGLPRDMVHRHPFPGPGLGVRILGEVKPEFADLLRRADAIFIEELRKTVDSHSGKTWYELTSQAFAVFLPVKSVGVMGDGRTYEHVVALRAVQTFDFMTADWAELPHALLKTVSTRIINEVRGINRVVYDVSSKPPATIEWE